VCAIKINACSNKLCIITIYSAPSRNTHIFITKLDMVLRNLDTSNLEFIICGDININYLPNSERKSDLYALLRTYNLIGTANFPTRNLWISTTAIDNIFIDVSRVDNYFIRPIIEVLFDHDAKSITVNKINMCLHAKQFKLTRKFNKHNKWLSN
jgi:hypothetical protein